MPSLGCPSLGHPKDATRAPQGRPEDAPRTTLGRPNNAPTVMSTHMLLFPEPVFIPTDCCRLTGAWLHFVQRNLSRPSFNRPVSSPQFPVSHECNVLAREQRFLVVKSSSILPSQWFFVSRDELKGGSLRRQRTPGQARLGRMDDDLTARNICSPASTLHSLESGN